MRILEVCAVDFTLYHFLVPLIRGIADCGHEVVAACADGPLAAEVRARGIRVESVPFSRRLLGLRSHWHAYRALASLLRRERFDMVHVHTPVAALIYTAHGFYFHELMAPWKRAVFVAVEWLGGRFTDVLLTQAEEDAAAAVRLGLCRGGVVAAIGNGVDPERFRPADDAEQRRALRRALATPDEACVIMVVGRLVAEKGYRELFEAMRTVDAVLWVVGERLATDHAQHMSASIEAVHDDDAWSARIRLLGYRTDVDTLLRAADVFALPSHREGMPRSIIEAMMTALPVVATDIRGSREEVVDGETGLLVPVRDSRALAAALDRLVRDPGLRRRMGAAARARSLALYDESKVIARQLSILGLAPAEASA
jgi:glycosyltransferase involved in cell wall biosynthesis